MKITTFLKLISSRTKKSIFIFSLFLKMNNVQKNDIQEIKSFFKIKDIKLLSSPFRVFYRKCLRIQKSQFIK